MARYSSVAADHWVPGVARTSEAPTFVVSWHTHRAHHPCTHNTVLACCRRWTASACQPLDVSVKKTKNGKDLRGWTFGDSHPRVPFPRPSLEGSSRVPRRSHGTPGNSSDPHKFCSPPRVGPPPLLCARHHWRIICACTLPTTSRRRSLMPHAWHPPCPLQTCPSTHTLRVFALMPAPPSCAPCCRVP